MKETMHLFHYFNAVDFIELNQKNVINKYSIGSIIKKVTEKLTSINIHKLDIAIIGIPSNNGNWSQDAEASTNNIREELYKLAKPNTNLNIADFGNLKECKSSKETNLAIRDIVDYLTEMKIVTIVLGGSQDLSYGICEAFKNNKFFTFSSVDALLDVKKSVEPFNSSNYLSRIFNTNPTLFQFSLIAFQSHLVPLDLFKKTKGISEHVSLGQLRDNIRQVEPILRNTDFLSFDFCSIKHAENPGNAYSFPNGLQSEEACQIAKYAGLSKRLQVLGIFEMDSGPDNKGISQKLSAQIVWYFIQGYLTRVPGSPENSDDKIVYKVEVKDVDNPLIFLKNPDTQQWWIQIQSLSGEKVLIACSENDYKTASDNEIPKLWLKYVQKIDELLK